jgi:hypothetical protein
MQDFLPASKEKAMQSITENLYLRLAELRQNNVIVEPSPEWYNPHDWASGHFKGRQSAIRAEIDFLESLLDKIERS